MFTSYGRIYQVLFTAWINDQKGIFTTSGGFQTATLHMIVNDTITIEDLQNTRPAKIYKPFNFQRSGR